MQVFSTRLPIKDSVTPKECLQVFIDWVNHSPHYPINSIDFDPSLHEDFEFSVDNVKVSIQHYKDDAIELFACRLENHESDVIWYNDFIFLIENNKKSLLVQLNCHRLDYNTQLPYIHKPYIIRKALESGICKDDGILPVTDEPMTVECGFLDSCAKIMRGEAVCSMPVVYVSCDYWGHTALSPKYLAHQLGGVAHVFAETDYNSALKLKEMANGNNAHTGYIGVYFPGMKFCQKYATEWYRSYKAMSASIISDIWSALINRLDSTSYNWNQILALRSRQKMAEWQDISYQDREKLNAYIETFDTENEGLKNQIKDLNQQNFSLRSQLDTLKATMRPNDAEICFYKMGTEPSLYPSERNDLLFSILSQVQQKYEKNSRAYTIIQSLLEANPCAGECARIMEGIRSVFSNGGTFNKASKSQLKELGFSIEEGGSHYKITFHDPRYSFTVAKTPSDHREGKNLVSDICKVLDVGKKI